MRGQANWVLGVVALIAVVLVASQLGIMKMPFSQLGGHVIGLSQVYIESADPLLAGKTWVASVVVNGGGQKLIGDSYSGAELGSLTPGADTFKDRLDLTFRSDKLAGTYSLQKTNSLYKFDPVPASFSFTLGGGVGGLTCSYTVDGSRWFSPRGYYPENSGGVSGSACGGTTVASDSPIWTNAYKSQCSSIGGIPIYKSVNLISDKPFTGDIYGKVWKCYKPNPIPVYQAYQINSPSFEWAVTFTLTNSKGADSLTATQSNSSGKSTGGNFVASFVGAYNSLNQQFPNNADATVLIGAGKTGLVSKITDFDAYGTQFPGSMDQLTEAAWSTYLSQRNSLIDKAFGTTPYDWRNGQVVGTQKVVVDLSSQPPFYPTFQLLVKADWLGIGIPLCKPEIVSSTCDLRAATGGVITANLKNNGDSEASCVASAVSKDSRLTIGSPEQRISIPTGTTQLISWGQVTATSKTNTQMKYSLTFRDSIASASSVSQDFYCNVAGECTLTPQGNFIVDYAKCELVCPLQESSCTALGKSLDAVSCTCYSGPTVPPLTECIDGTPLGECSDQSDGYLCTDDGKLVKNDSCKTDDDDGGACPSGSISVLGACVDLMQLGIALVLIIALGYALTRGKK